MSAVSDIMENRKIPSGRYYHAILRHTHTYGENKGVATGEPYPEFFRISALGPGFPETGRDHKVMV